MEDESKVECGRCMDIVPSINADGMCDGFVEETNDAELTEEEIE